MLRDKKAPLNLDTKRCVEEYESCFLEKLYLATFFFWSLFCLLMRHVINKLSTVVPLEGRNAYQTYLPPVVSPHLYQKGDPTFFPSSVFKHAPQVFKALQNHLTYQTDLSFVWQINHWDDSRVSDVTELSSVRLSTQSVLITPSLALRNSCAKHCACQGRLIMRRDESVLKFHTYDE